MRSIYPLLLASFLMLGCSSRQKRNQETIFYAGGESGLGHMLKVKANISGVETLLIFDTGIGINLISKRLCLKLNCKIDGALTGKRMTGQSVTIPMSKIDSLSFAGQSESDVDVGVLDFEGFLPKTKEFEGVQGYLSLKYFENRPFTIDYRSGLFTIETQTSLIARSKNSVTIPIVKKYEGQALTIQISVKTQIKKKLIMQLDLGTDIMTVNSYFLEEFKPFFESSHIKKELIVDETNFKRERFFVKLDGLIGLSPKQIPSQSNPIVMFQKIIYDGIIGNDFFKGRVVTYDLKNSRLIVNQK